MAVFQDACPPGTMAQVLAARSSLLILASPIGTALGGPIVAALGARGTLLTSALATIVLGLITAAVLARARTAKAASAVLHVASLASPAKRNETSDSEATEKFCASGSEDPSAEWDT